jgi:FG-GAP repeat
MRAQKLTLAGLSVLLAACGSSADRESWAEQHAALNEQGWLELTTSDYGANDFFGWSVALDDSRALVGSPGRGGATEDESSSGAARVFERDASGVMIGPELVANPRVKDAWLGDSVALRGQNAALGSSSAVVSPIGDESPGSETEAGLAYAFRLQGSEWRPQRLPDPRFGSGRRFGLALGATADEVLVGAPAVDQPGEVFAFRFDDSGQWQLEQTLTSPQSTVDDEFGYSIAVDETTLIVGAPGAGRAQIFARTGAELGWRWVAELQANLASPIVGDKFGSALALAADRAVVGAAGDDTIKPVAYVFERQGGVWRETPTHELRPADDDLASGGFAQTLAIGQDRLWIGAPYYATGAVAAFEWKDGNWQANDALAPALPEPVAFGSGIAARGRSLLVGAPLDEEARGSAFLITRVNGASCEVATDCQSGHCVEGLCCDSPCAGCFSCRAADKQTGDDGECGPVKAGQRASSTTCLESSPESCGQTGACDGAGDCALYDAGTPCRAASCANASTLKMARSCDGGGACGAAKTKTCGHLSCIAGSCEPCQKDESCGADELCGEDGCEAKRGLLSPCTKGRECLSGFCPAEHCTDRAECADDGSEVVELDGSRTPCGRYACRDGTCLSSCDDSADCQTGFACSSEQCATPVAPSGPSSASGSSCRSSADCDFGFACGNDGRCAPIPAARTSTASGGCAATGAPLTNDWQAALVACLLTYLRAERARSTSRKRKS